MPRCRVTGGSNGGSEECWLGHRGHAPGQLEQTAARRYGAGSAPASVVRAMRVNRGDEAVGCSTRLDGRVWTKQTLAVVANALEAGPIGIVLELEVRRPVFGDYARFQPDPLARPSVIPRVLLRRHRAPVFGASH